MTDLERALAEITHIRKDMARAVEFRGLGAATLAATGGLALLGAAAQRLWIADPRHEIEAYLGLWIAVAALSVALIAGETVLRTARVHSGLAQEMILAGAEQFLPAAVAGALVTAVLYRAAPTALPLLPALWQIFFALGVLASRRSLPPAIGYAGLWYLATGLLVLTLGEGEDALAPWTMGLPFGIGQGLVAIIVHRHGGEEVRGEADGEA